MWKNFQLEIKIYSTLENSDWEKHQENSTCRKTFIWRSELIDSLQGHIGEKKTIKALLWKNLQQENTIHYTKENPHREVTL